jgi:hypothetical protein
MLGSVLTEVGSRVAIFHEKVLFRRTHFSLGKFLSAEKVSHADLNP